MQKEATDEEIKELQLDSQIEVDQRRLQETEQELRDWKQEESPTARKKAAVREKEEKVDREPGQKTGTPTK